MKKNDSSGKGIPLCEWRSFIDRNQCGNCWEESSHLFYLSDPGEQIVGNNFPIWKSIRSKQNQFSMKLISTIIGPVIYQKIAIVQVFMVRQYQSLIGRLSKMLPYPGKLI
jgi:hypothetical protein